MISRYTFTSTDDRDVIMNIFLLLKNKNKKNIKLKQNLNCVACTRTKIDMSSSIIIILHKYMHISYDTKMLLIIHMTTFSMSKSRL